MNIRINQEDPPDLGAYAGIRMAFEVQHLLDVKVLDGGLGGFTFSDRAHPKPYQKDYDAAGGPLQWPEDFDMTHWAIFVAREEGVRVGGAAIVFDTPGLTMLEDRRDIAVLWDIRIAPTVRRKGVGAMLFGAAEQWAVAQGCRRLKVETQNINVPACRFYAAQGCELEAVHRLAYPDFPEETQLLWYKDLV